MDKLLFKKIFITSYYWPFSAMAFAMLSYMSVFSITILTYCFVHVISLLIIQSVL